MTFDYKKEYKEFYMPKQKPELVTVPKMNYIAVRGSGYVNDFSDSRRHHEIYLSDARRVAPERLKTAIRHPVKKVT